MTLLISCFVEFLPTFPPLAPYNIAGPVKYENLNFGKTDQNVNKNETMVKQQFIKLNIATKQNDK